MRIVRGLFSFVLFSVFDFLKLGGKKKFAGPFFLLGVGVLLESSVKILSVSAGGFGFPKPLYAAGACICFLFMFYCLFGALPFGKTYATGESDGTISTGVYAVCRHPGVLGFFLGYMFLYLLTGSAEMFWAWILWSAADVLHVFVQDIYFFPLTLSGYDKYKTTTPFLIPNLASIKKASNRK